MPLPPLVQQRAFGDILVLLNSGHVSSEKIEAALQQLMSLGVLTHHLQPGRGRHANLWSTLPDAEPIDPATAEEHP